jgi:molybdopterin-guanine dinucleotide biosynthesis protein A
VQRVIGRLPPLDEVIVVTSSERLSALAGLRLEARLVVDVFTGMGPLGGIHAGLLSAGGSYGVVVGCDMPFLNTGLVEHMLELRQGFDIVVPRLGGRAEPLHAVYSRDCIHIIERQMRQDRMEVHHLLDVARVRYLEEDEVDRFDPEHLSFFNVNDDVDLRRARELVGGGR